MTYTQEKESKKETPICLHLQHSVLGKISHHFELISNYFHLISY